MTCSAIPFVITSQGLSGEPERVRTMKKADERADMGIFEVELGANFGAALESIQGQVGVFTEHNGCLSVGWGYVRCNGR